jgi:hypothetical protein
VHFPDVWQEIVLFEESTGEKHVADVRTERGIAAPDLQTANAGSSWTWIVPAWVSRIPRK